MKKIRSFFQNLKQKISFAKKTSSQEAETEDDFADSFAESPTTEKTGWHEVNPEVFKTSALTQEKEKSFSSVRRKINLQSLPALIFSPRYRGQVHRFFILLLLLVSFYSLGKIIAVFLAQPNTDLKTLALPLLKGGNASTDLEAIRLANLFDSDVSSEEEVPKEEFNPIVDENLVCRSATQRSDLPIKLFDTIVLLDQVKSIASVQVRDAKIDRFRQGDKINDLAQVGSIERLRIILKNLKNGRCEYIDFVDALLSKNKSFNILPPDEGEELIKSLDKNGIVNEGNQFKIPRKVIAEKMKDLSAILTQARALKIDNPDGSQCYKIVDVDPGGIFAFFGIQNQDDICAINGAKITNMNQVMNLFGRLTQLSRVNLTVRRDGGNINLDYRFVD